MQESLKSLKKVRMVEMTPLTHIKYSDLHMSCYLESVLDITDHLHMVLRYRAGSAGENFPRHNLTSLLGVHKYTIYSNNTGVACIKDELNGWKMRAFFCTLI